MDIANLVCIIVAIVLLVVVIIKSGKSDDKSFKELSEQLEKLKSENSANLREQRQEITTNIQNSVKNLGDLMIENQRIAFDGQSKRIEDMDKSVTDKQQAMSEAVSAQMKNLENRFKTLEANNEQKLEAMRGTISKQLNYIQEDNNKKLDEIRTTVDEKLQKTLEDKMNQSFKLVSERLEEVYKGLGEMQNLATGVGDLKKVLSNVKTRGILGEIQLGAILAVIVLFFHKLNPFAPSKSTAEKKQTWDLWFKVVAAIIPSGVVGILLAVLAVITVGDDKSLGDIINISDTISLGNIGGLVAFGLLLATIVLFCAKGAKSVKE